MDYHETVKKKKQKTQRLSVLQWKALQNTLLGKRAQENMCNVLIKTEKGEYVFLLLCPCVRKLWKDRSRIQAVPCGTGSMRVGGSIFTWLCFCTTGMRCPYHPALSLIPCSVPQCCPSRTHSLAPATGAHTPMITACCPPPRLAELWYTLGPLAWQVSR